MPGEPEWPAERTAKLRRLWDTPGLSTRDIANRLHTTKNAVLGKAHRLGLPAKDSPIIRSSSDARRRSHARVERAGLVTLPPLASLA